MQPSIAVYPAAQPWLHLYFIGLQINGAIAEQAVFVMQIHSDLHIAVLTFWRREHDLTFCAVARGGV